MQGLGMFRNGMMGLRKKFVARLVWVADKELNLSYYIGETLLSTIYIYIYVPIMVTQIKFLDSNPVVSGPRA